MPIVIDGNNLLHSMPHHQRSREEVRRAILDQCRREKMSVTVVFDGHPPQGTPTTEHLGQVMILYSGSKCADDVIINHLPSGKSAHSWSVVTNDRGLATRAREKGAAVRTLAQWTRRRNVKPRLTKPRPKPALRPNEVQRWEREFAERDRSEDDQPVRILRTKKA